MSEIADVLVPSSPYPLGAVWDGRGTHFAVFSEHAERMELCLFDHNGRHEIARLPMPECTDQVWHGYLHNARPGQLYGYRAYGPYDPKRGQRFNPNKLLLDPYARQLAGQLHWHDALYGYRVGSGRGDLSFDRRDSAAHMPKAVVTDEYFDWGGDRLPNIPWSDTVIYEMHLRGFTRLRQDIPEHDRGTFGALGRSSTIEYFKRLGVTAVELLPIHAFVRDRRLVEQNLTNYWGYNTLSYFCPDPAYLSDGTLGQLKWAVKKLHAEGIEVLLDVVYNHTCEGSELGPTLSWKGLDNTNYYRLIADDPRHYANDTGCGNTVNFSHPRVIQMTMDSLRYWAEEFHIDGFRFDLGTTLGREIDGFDPGSGFFDALLQDPVLQRRKLIFEPWDIGPGGYQLGGFPSRTAEWNDRFRDDVRKYWRGDEGMRKLLASRLQGSAELFDHECRRPWSSVNFITAHDGFTLHDVVSYNGKHNEANAEENRDGTDDNNSANWGEEGDSDDPDILTLRAKLMRSFFATLLLSHGTPMLLSGDEVGHSQGGNNNAYPQDNEISWFDWQAAESDPAEKMFRFVSRLIELRKTYPLLRGIHFQHARIDVAEGLKDIFWFDERGTELSPEDWDNPLARLLGLRRAARCPDGAVEVMILLFNSDSAAHRFKLPEPSFPFTYLLDTRGFVSSDDYVANAECEVEAHSVVLLTSRVPPSDANGEHLHPRL